LQKVETLCERLAHNPEMGQLRTEFATGQFRSFSIGVYVICFQPTKEGARIARILYGARDHDALR
jgi:plasmid stabilization system protein ParE